jgi:hypothetical protein
MTRTIVKVHLPGGIGSGKIEYKGGSVIFADIEGNVFDIPETLIERLHGFLVAERELTKETLTKPSEPPTKKSPTSYSRRTIHEGD